MKKLLAVLLALVLALSVFTACGGAVSSQVTSTPAASSSEPEPEVIPYTPDPLTGENIADTGYVSGTRLTAVMVNNIAVCRPQRGLSEAGIVFEIKVEGGITRFMAVYNDYSKIQTVGPVRSARDQFWRLVAPWQPLYVHDGESVVQTQYIKDYDYGDLNITQVGQFTWRDPNRVAPHNEYTSGEKLAAYFASVGSSVERDYKNYTFFDYVDYNEPARELTGGSATTVNIIHSNSYRTYFDYNSDTMTYFMSQYSSSIGGIHKTIDENTNQQLNFKNVLVLFTDIHTYPGHEAKDLQYADYDFGGVGMYFCNGKYENVRWVKGASAWDALRIVDNHGNEVAVKLNTGKTYVAMVDLDEAPNFTFSSATGATGDANGRVEDLPTSTTTEVELGEED